MFGSKTSTATVYVQPASIGINYVVMRRSWQDAFRKASVTVGYSKMLLYGGERG